MALRSLSPAWAVSFAACVCACQGRCRAFSEDGLRCDPVMGLAHWAALARACSRIAKLLPCHYSSLSPPAGPRIYQLDPLARDASEGFIGVTFGWNFLGNEALNGIAGSRAAVKERRHRRIRMP
jgi:hypothetical protein